ncbi:hypothetical protein CE561_04755 [Thermoanaerobacterium thermosaccharolyticum]|uniref:Uncharacterized protein n=1 Tax=Thermoanaerobacterium thermosaccharolyticum TaxID=1517 RepID=A0A231VKG5_THETR|nr:hypothetical protein [Thermoanaerobacterium thermosaccharolyticum]OXT08608.1 hypothetical protein CE561_04755 [Thermoanaerobacterium thermosaccharolyticum]
MDKRIIKGYVNFTLKRVIKQKSIYIIFLYMLIFPYLAIKTNVFSREDNFWSGVFYLLGSRYIYGIFFLTTFLLLIYNVCNDSNITPFVHTRLDNKINWLISKYILIFITSIIYLILIIFSVYIGVYLNLGYSPNWSSSAINGDDLYTLFAKNLTPFSSIIIYYIRFHLSLIVLGMLEMALAIGFTSVNYGLSLAISIIIALVSTVVLNLRNIPVINLLDIGNIYIFSFNSNYNLIEFIVANNFHLLIMIVAIHVLLKYNLKEIVLK